MGQRPPPRCSSICDGCWRPSAGRSHPPDRDRKSTRLNSSHSQISYAVFCLKKKKRTILRSAEHAHEVEIVYIASLANHMTDPEHVVCRRLGARSSASPAAEHCRLMRM